MPYPVTRKTILYLLAEFPSHTETFILKEMLSIQRTFRLQVFALKKGKGGIHKNVLGEKLIYVPGGLSWEVLRSHGRFALKQPFWIQKWKTFLPDVLRKNLRYSAHRIRSLLIASYLAEKITGLGIHHIHAHFANYPTEIACLISQYSGIPFSFTAHAHDIYIPSCHLAGQIRGAAFVTTCTGYNKKWLSKLVSREESAGIHLVYHGVDLEEWPCRKTIPAGNPFRILVIGRLIEKKGMIFLLEAMHRLSARNMPVHLHIVGKGCEYARLKRYCREYGLLKTVSFMGWQTPEQIRDLFFHSGLFVLPSVIAADGDRDGIPNVILEAMASGVPVISTPVSGIPEVIMHGYSGWLVPERDSRQLADAIRLLQSNKELYAAIASNARKTIEEKFDRKQCIQQLMKLFADD